MANQPKTPQMNVRLPRDKRAKLIAIARVRGERDDLGAGASAVLRQLVDGYLAEHADELPDWWEDLL